MQENARWRTRQIAATQRLAPEHKARGLDRMHIAQRNYVSFLTGPVFDRQFTDGKVRRLRVPGLLLASTLAAMALVTASD